MIQLSLVRFNDLTGPGISLKDLYIVTMYKFYEPALQVTEAQQVNASMTLLIGAHQLSTICSHIGSGTLKGTYRNVTKYWLHVHGTYMVSLSP